MKKILSLVLILAMVLCLFAGCGEDPAPTQAGASLEDAKAYLYAMYKEDDGTIARRDFSMVAAVMIDGVTFPITWTTDSAYATVGAVENNMVKIDIEEAPAEEVIFKLTGTLTDAEGKTATVTITRVIEAAKTSGTEFVAAPVAGTAYKFAVQQNNLGQTIYFTGEMSGYYLATSANPFDAVDVYVEDVDGGQRIYFNNAEGVKTYIDVIPRGEDQPGKVNVVLTEAPTCVYTWDAERKTFVTNTVADNVWYLGCYNTYNTISASNVSYIEKVEVIGDTQFPAGFCTVNVVATQVAAPAAGTPYKFAVQQNNLGQTIYFTGAMSGYYLGTSVNPAEGVNVFVEEVEGGSRLYFMKGDVKMYIDVIPRGEDQPGKVNVVLTEAPTCVYTWDAERKTFVTNTVADNVWYLGCYNTYNTMSASNVSYIEKVEVIGESQFPAGPYVVEGFMELQPDLDKHEHTPASAVVENEKAATCTENGSYDSVVYCSECKEKISSETKTVAALGHTPGETVQENLVGGGCGEAGSYDEVVKCTVCEAEISRTTVEIPATGDHNYINEVDRQEPTCTVDGFVKKACSCGAESTEVLPAAHTAGEAVKENEVPATVTTEGSYESVVYCSVCNAEMSRETVATPVLEIPENGVVAGVGYKIKGYNANGDLWYSGTVGNASSGRFDITVNEAEAAVVYVENVDGGYLMYTTDGTTKTYIIMNDSSSGGALTTNAAEATVFVWNETLSTLMVAAEDNQRAFGCQNASTYANFSCYATSNTEGYNWGQFIPVA